MDINKLNEIKEKNKPIIKFFFVLFKEFKRDTNISKIEIAQGLKPSINPKTENKKGF